VAISARENGGAGLQSVVLAIVAALQELDRPRRAVALALFTMALKDAQDSAATSPFAQPFLVTPRSMEKRSCGLDQTALLDAMEHLRRSMPAVSSPDGMHSGAGGTGLMLFDVVRTIRTRSEDTQFVWWVRPGQWAHWHLTPPGRIFVCRMMAAWGAAESREVGQMICRVGTALANHADISSEFEMVSVPLESLLESDSDDLVDQPGLTRQALSILEERKLIMGFEHCADKSMTLSAKTSEPEELSQSWLKAIIQVPSTNDSLMG